MIDDLIAKTQESESRAKDYLKARKESTESAVEFRIFQARHLDRIKGDSRAGIEMLELMTMKYEPKMEDVYKSWKVNEGLYKGYERVLDALRDGVNTTKAIMKAENYGG